MTTEDYNRTIEALEKERLEVTKTPETARAFLKKWGLWELLEDYYAKAAPPPPSESPNRW